MKNHAAANDAQDGEQESGSGGKSRPEARTASPKSTGAGSPGALLGPLGTCCVFKCSESFLTSH